MNCDRVFEILTSGPFPRDDESDSQVETHLAICHNCRQLAEALRPAIRMIHESIVEERDSLPSYAGPMTPRGNRIMEQIRAADTNSRPWRRKEGQTTSSPRLASWNLALAPVGMIALILVAYGAKDHVPATPADLSGLGLPNACHDVPNSTTEANDGSRPNSASTYYCCTHCHSAKHSEIPQFATISKLIQACGACHESAPNDGLANSPWPKLLRFVQDRMDELLLETIASSRSWSNTRLAGRTPGDWPNHSAPAVIELPNPQYVPATTLTMARTGTREWPAMRTCVAKNGSAIDAQAKPQSCLPRPHRFAMSSLVAFHVHRQS